MKVLVLIGLIFAALLQVEARSIGVQSDDHELPKVLKDTMEQSFSCGMKLGPTKASKIPRIHGIELLPEDNEALVELWGCIWKKKGIVEENGDVHGDVLESYLVDLASIFGTPSSDELKTAHELTERCKHEQADEYGLKAVKIQNCLNRHLQGNLRRR